jgi:hypothetical protein
MTDIITSQNIDLSSWITLYIHTEIYYLFGILEALSSIEGWKGRSTDEHKIPIKIL